jgi:PEGA domain
VKKARELWYRGVDAFRNGRYEEARQAFSDCYTLMPKSDVLRNLSISEIQSGHYVAAARHLTQLLSGADLPADVREEATRRLAQAEAQIGKLNFTVDVPGAVVSIDGAPIGRTPLEGGWYIEPGQHEVSVSKPGYPNEPRQIYALAGVAIPITVSLESLRREQERDAHAAQLMGTREGETARDRGLGTASTITLITTGTLAAAGFIAGIYFTVAANGHDSDADAIASNLTDSRVCAQATQLMSDCKPLWQEQEDAHHDRQRAQVSFIGFGVASAATLGYALYLLLDSDDEAKPRPRLNSAHRLEPGFALGADRASFSLQGQF